MRRVSFRHAVILVLVLPARLRLPAVSQAVSHPPRHASNL
jgi:hypothetical protein